MTLTAHISFLHIVHLGCFDRFVSKQKGNYRPVDSCEQQLHRVGMPKHVRRNIFSLKRCTSTSSTGNVLSQQITNSVRAQRTSTSIREERFFRSYATFFEPCGEGLDRLF
jgi:hypothetical protein